MHRLLELEPRQPPAMGHAQEQTRQDAALQAYGYRTTAVSQAAQSQLLRAAAPMDVAGGFLTAGGTLLSRASNIGFGKWAGMQIPSPWASPVI